MLLLLFSGYGIASRDIQLDFWAAEEAFSARTFPALIAAGGMLFSTLLILTGKPMHLPALKELDIRPVATLLLLIFTFTLLIEPLGFILSGICLLAMAPLLLGEQRWKLIAGVSVGVVLGLYSLLTMLDVYIDPGMLRWLL